MQAIDGILGRLTWQSPQMKNDQGLCGGKDCHITQKDCAVLF